MTTATHGKPRTNLDKRRSVQTLLSDEEWSQKSDRWISEKAAVSHTLVQRLRVETTGNGCQLPPARLGKDGKERALPKPKKSEPPAAAPTPPPSPKRQMTIEARWSLCAELCPAVSAAPLRQ